MIKAFSSREESLSLIQDTQNMPTLPDRLLKIRAVINHPHSGSDELSSIIETDLATSSTLLKIANSAAYNPHHRSLSSLPHAISRLGISTSAEIGMSMALLQNFTSTKSINRVHSLWAHAFATATIAKYMYQRLSKAPLEHTVATVFMMGLLHDIGQVILAIRVDEDYFDRDFHGLHGEELCHAENAMYGINHAEAGAAILECWNMPDSLAAFTLNHHKASTNLAYSLCQNAESFIYKHWPNVQHIEEVQQLLSYSPIDKIDAALQASPVFQKYIT